MNKELIAKLKDPAQARVFYTMPKNEKDLLQAAGKHNCLVSWSQIWPVFEQSKIDEWVYSAVYILKPGWKPEPEYEDWEIKPHLANRTRLWAYAQDGNSTSLLGCVESTAFAGFHVNPGAPNNRCCLLEHIANAIHDGHTVVARFRTE